LQILVVQPTGDKVGHHGIWTVKLSQALAKMGHAVTVCTNQIYPERYITEPPAFQIELVGGGGLSFERFDRALSRRPLVHYWGYYRNSYRVAAAALTTGRSRSFDVVYMTDVEFLTASLILKAHRGPLPPIVMEVSAANFSFLDYPGSVWRKWYKVFQREVFRTTLGREIAACAVLGEWHQERLRAQLRLSPAFPLVVIPDGGEIPKESLSREEARRRLGIDYAGPILLFFGALRKDKGLETLVRAIARLPALEFRVVIAGHPLEYTAERVAALVREAGVDHKVVLRLGFVDEADVPAYFFAADALILPYPGVYRGGSGPLMKGACTYGRPVVASDVSEMGLLVKRHRLGLITDPDNPVSLAEGLETFLSMSQEARDQMGARAQALARANTWEAMAERFSRLFESLVRPADRAACSRSGVL